MNIDVNDHRKLRRKLSSDDVSTGLRQACLSRTFSFGVFSHAPVRRVHDTRAVGGSFLTQGAEHYQTSRNEYENTITVFYLRDVVHSLLRCT